MIKPRRRIAMRADCPKCGAMAGDLCFGKSGHRKQIHRSRMQATAIPVGRKPRLVVVEAEPLPFYQSREWRRLRYQALKLHGAACQCCGTRGTRHNPLHVDHIKPRSKFPALELDLSNLQVLCADCNLGKSAWDETDWRA